MKSLVEIEYPKLTGIGIILIIVGLVILGVKGLPLVLDPTPHEIQTEDIVHPIKLDKVTSVNLISFDNNSGFDYIKLNFDTVTLFAGDSVNVKATVYGVKPNVVAIVLLSAEPFKNFTTFTKADIKKEFIIDQAFNESITLTNQTSPQFQTTAKIAFPIAYQPVKFSGFTFLNDGNFSQFENKVKQLTVLPITEKLQSETNLATLLQINATNKATLAQDTYNNIVLGLTWLGVGAIPILVGTDILLRIYISE